MHDIEFIQDLAIIMAIAGLVTVLFHRFKQPVVLGYILAGVIIGPHTPPFALIQDEETVQILAELGVVFLLFSLGLEFSLRKLARVGMTAVIAAIAEIVLMVWLGYEIGRFFGWRPMDSIFLGAILAISSTTIIVKALDDLKLKKEHFAQVIFGVLIVEDMLAIGIIAVLSSMAVSGEVDAGLAFGTFGMLALFMIVSMVVGILVVPRLLAYVARFHSAEMLLITVLGLLFGFCLLVVKLDYSLALGAFLIGAIMAEAKELKEIERLIEPLRDMFSAVFFVTIGLLLDPKVMLEYALPIAIVSVAVVLGKFVSCGFGAFISGQSGRDSIRIGMGLSQIGEFSFIIASLGLTLGVTSKFLYPIAVAVSAITTLTTPYLIRLADPLSAMAARSAPAPVARMAEAYSRWLGSIRPQGERALIAKMIRRIILHVMVNLSLVTAIFLGAAYAMRHVDFLMHLPMDLDSSTTLVWACALLLSLPFLIAAYRKLKALSLMLAEMSAGVDASYNEGARRVIAEVIPALSIVVLMVIVSALSSSILPPTGSMIVVLVGIAVVAAATWRWLVRLHARLQAALMDNLGGPNKPK
ncbi:MAG TPA: cation:proton antiporter [Burkholderiales bacterium]|nr:cation:proton antiporter [Burkholderiales bacterium]